MGNIINFFKKTIANKNTVTILLVLAGIVVLWVFYSMRVKEATTPIKVPYAKEELKATEEITEEKIGYVEVNSKLLKTADIIQSQSALIGYYVTTGTSIPKGGLFYKSQVVTKAELPNSVFDNIPDKHTIYSMSVNNHTTFGNSIYPGDKIDLYYKTSDNGKLVYGKLIEGITVLAVKDSNGNHIFKKTASQKDFGTLIFSLSEELHLLFRKASLVDGDIIPVTRNQDYCKEGGCNKVTSEYLRNLIESQVDDAVQDNVSDSDNKVKVTE